MHRSGYLVQMPASAPNPRKRRKTTPTTSANEEILCSVCDIWVTGVVQYQSHVQGAKHLRKSKEKSVDQVLGRMPFITYDSKGGMYTCTVCNVLMNSSLVGLMHVHGMRHAENMEKYEKERKNGTAKPDPGPTVDPAKLDEDPERKLLENIAQKLAPVNMRETSAALVSFNCDVCDIKTNSEIQLKQHLESARHKNKLANPSAEPLKKKEGLKLLECSVCKIFVNSQTQYDQHLASEKHKTNSLAEQSTS